MTVNWDTLLDQSSLASLLPDEHAAFARPVRDGLRLFLEGLSEASQNSILRAQTALPLETTFFERIAVLAQTCPVLHKLGQVLARDQRLAPELRLYLRRLESLPPSVPLPAIQGM